MNNFNKFTNKYSKVIMIVQAFIIFLAMINSTQLTNDLNDCEVKAGVKYTYIPPEEFMKNHKAK